MGKARRVSHQPLEESITDKNMIELKARHPSEVITTTFNRRKEATTGADWEWWFTNSKKNAWFGVRVQAKILKFKSERYEALNYKDQTNVLIADAARGGLVPLYCFYSHWPLSHAVTTSKCQTFPNAPETYGCAIVDAHTIRTMKSQPNADSLANIMAASFPWSCLVCCNGGLGNLAVLDLPSKVRHFVANVLVFDSEIDVRNIPKIIDTPPRHVIETMQQEAPDFVLDDPNLAGVVIIVGNEG